MISFEVVAHGEKTRFIGYTLPELKVLFASDPAEVTIWVMHGWGDGVNATAISVWHKPAGKRRFQRGTA